MNRHGTLGWAGLIAYVVAYDYWACKTKHETLTQAFHRMGGNPLVIISSALVVKHLALPRVFPRLDPINHLAERWRFEIEEIREIAEAFEGYL